MLDYFYRPCVSIELVYFAEPQNPCVLTKARNKLKPLAQSALINFPPSNSVDFCKNSDVDT